MTKKFFVINLTLWQKCVEICMWKIFDHSSYVIVKLEIICFFFFKNTDRNALQNFLNSNYIGLNKKKLLLEMIFDLAKCPNQKMHESESAVFSPMSEIIFKSSFLIKSYIFTVLIFLWSVLVRLIRKKNWISIFISKMDLVYVGGYFHICI